MTRRPPRSTRTDTLFPYTTLFRSILRVLRQADAPYRMTPEDVLALKVRNASGEMVPFSSFTQVEWTSGPQQLQRYNGYPAMTISGMAAPGRSTGEAMAEMAQIGRASCRERVCQYV